MPEILHSFIPIEMYTIDPLPTIVTFVLIAQSYRTPPQGIPFSGKVWRTLNLANWLSVGIGKI